MIVAKDIVKKYRIGSEEFIALKEVSIEVKKGEFTAVMGPSGSGKSTFMNILGCLDTSDSGTYSLNGKNISSIKGDELARIRNKDIGFVFQAFNLLPRMNILDNVALPMVYAGVSPKERKQRAMMALEKVGLLDRIAHRPNEISGGQKQRVAIARAIVNNPAVIMADEPTGNLDTKASEEIMKIFQQLNSEGTTIVMVTHEPDIAMYTKRIVKFRDGNIIEDMQVEKRRLLL